MREQYEFDPRSGRGVRQSPRRLSRDPDDTRASLSELQHGALVCRDLAMLWTGDTHGEYRSDMEVLGESVQKFVAAYP